MLSETKKLNKYVTIPVEKYGRLNISFKNAPINNKKRNNNREDTKS
tara:strand:- start:440 stop:577 length:138 start_codon:yes stop_codon:yes gene_type:complete